MSHSRPICWLVSATTAPAERSACIIRNCASVRGPSNRRSALLPGPPAAGAAAVADSAPAPAGVAVGGPGGPGCGVEVGRPSTGRAVEVVEASEGGTRKG